jgi:hypothetical protein
MTNIFVIFHAASVCLNYFLSDQGVTGAKWRLLPGLLMIRDHRSHCPSRWRYIVVAFSVTFSILHQQSVTNGGLDSALRTP